MGTTDKATMVKEEGTSSKMSPSYQAIFLLYNAYHYCD